MIAATEPRERGILFSDRLVRAILEGRKTQTRRIVKPQPDPAFRLWGGVDWDGYQLWTDHPHQGDKGKAEHRRCPYGVPGDRLYVREAHTFNTANQPIYRADYPDNCERRGMENIPPLEDVRWKPSIHMPKWVSRIMLEVAGVRVERVQEIRRDDAFAEGVEHVDPYEETDDLPPGMPACFRNYLTGGWFAGDPVASFQTAWDSVNTHPDGCTWADNPWVWVIEFRRIDR